MIPPINQLFNFDYLVLVRSFVSLILKKNFFFVFWLYLTVITWKFILIYVLIAKANLSKIKQKNKYEFGSLYDLLAPKKKQLEATGQLWNLQLLLHSRFNNEGEIWNQV